MRTSIALLLLAAAVAASGGAAEPAAGANGRGKLVEIPSRFDGIVLLIGREVRQGEEVPADQLFTVRIGEVARKYRRLEVGDAVEAGEVLARLDDLLVRDELVLKKQKVSAAETGWKATLKTRDEAEQRYQTMWRLFNGGVGCCALSARAYLHHCPRRLADCSRPSTPEGSLPGFPWGDVATPIRPTTGRRSLPPSSSTRSPVG
jgi:hypothetical protein